MADKPATYRISTENREKLEALWKNMNIGSRNAVEFYLALRGPILKQVEQKVDGDDVTCLASVLSSSQMDPQFMASSRVLIGKITARIESLDGEKHKKQKSNMMVLAEKVKSFTPWECYVLQEEIFRRTGSD